VSSPYFSIVIDNYNYGRFIADAIEGVLKQDFPEAERELIVVDDGSTDNSISVISGYKDKVKLLTQKNQRQAAAFQTGFNAAKGQVVCLLDSDDYFHPEKLKVVAEKMKDPAVGIVQHLLRDVDAGKRPLNNPLPAWPAAYTLTDLAAGRCENAATSGLAFRRSVLDQLLPVPTSVFCFYDEYLLGHGLFVTDVVNVPRILGYHRLHGNNYWAQRNENPAQLEAHIREQKAFHQSLEPKLRARGLSFAPRYSALLDMEIKRREILLAVHQGRRGQAFGIWRALAAAHGKTPLGAFRSATCLLALLSPALYLKIHGLYSQGGTLAKLRKFFLPDPR
jgi:glycosyltransferase involved in cell wall biosynthesis